MTGSAVMKVGITVYKIEVSGSPNGETATLEKALIFTKEKLLPHITTEEQILIWKVSPTGHREIVWQYPEQDHESTPS